MPHLLVGKVLIISGNVGYRLATFHLRLLALAAAALGGASALASADEIHRSNWVPNVGDLDRGEQPLGDMWTFRCPPGGSVRASVDTKDDTDAGQSDIDPVLLIFDGQGNLLRFGDDEAICTFPPVCGALCPSVRADCGEAGRHSIVVRDFGAAEGPGTPCQEGGGYELTVEVSDSGGQSLSEREVRLGGGPRKVPAVPRWARDLGKAPVGPILDDEDVPQGVESDKVTCVIIGPGSVDCEVSVGTPP